MAQAIERYVRVVGRERVIAGTDCGFGTMAGRSAVVPEVAYAKLASLAEGAAGRLSALVVSPSPANLAGERFDAPRKRYQMPSSTFSMV